MSESRRRPFPHCFYGFAMGAILILGTAEPGQAQVPEMSGTWVAVETSFNGEVPRSGEQKRHARGAGETMIAVEGDSVTVTRTRLSRTYIVDGQVHRVDGRDVRASWDGDLLVLETPRGTEIWEWSGSGELTITRRIGESVQIRVLRRR